MRAPTREEEATILGSLEAAARGLAEAFVGDRVLRIQERDDVRRVVLAAPDLDGLPAEILDGADAVGLWVGVLDGGFRLELQGAVRWAACTDAQTVRVTERAARLFLYGRNILGDSVLRADRRLAPGDACIVCNPRGEGLGLGEVVGRFKGPGEAIRPVHDLGTYLRDQG